MWALAISMLENCTLIVPITSRQTERIRPAGGRSRIEYPLTDPSQFDILQSGWLRGPNAIRSNTTARVHHAARRRSRVAAHGARAAGRSRTAHWRVDKQSMTA